MEQIKIDEQTRKLDKQTIIIGYTSENKIENIKFEIPEKYNNYNKKACFRAGKKEFSLLIGEDNILTLTSDITKFKQVDMAIEFFADDIVARTSVLKLIFRDTVTGGDVLPSDPKVIILNELIQQVNNLDVDLAGTNLTITKKDGTKKSVDTKGEKGDKGEPGAVKMQVVDTLPQTGRTDTIYLVKKDNPGEQNLYDEYVYTDTGWEHIGDTSVDLSNYQEKLTPGDNINIDNNVISATFQKEVIELTDETIVLKDLEVGIYRITRSVLHIKVGNTNYNINGYWNCLMLVDYYRSWRKRGYIFSEGNIWCFTDEDYGYVGKSIKDIMSTRAAQTIVATHTYNILPASTVVPVQDNQFTNKKYVDDLPTTYTGYDATKTQVLKNINGTLTWVNEG